MPSITTGVLWIHSAPLALQPHLKWAVARLRDPETGKPIRVTWRTQNQQTPRSTICAEVQFYASAFDALAVADHLSGWPHLYFEMAIDADESFQGKRICHTPELGTFRADTDAVGNVVLNENVVRAMMSRTAANESGNAQIGAVDDGLRDSLDAALGGPWDRVLEPMRLVTAGYEVFDYEQSQSEQTQFTQDHSALSTDNEQYSRECGGDDVVVRLYPRRAVM